jgi:hypothetical protein
MFTWAILIAGMLATIGLVVTFGWYLRRRLRKAEAAAEPIHQPKPPSSEVKETTKAPPPIPAHP